MEDYQNVMHIDNLKPEFAGKIQKIYEDYDPKKNKIKDAKIILKDDVPIKQRPTRLSWSEKEEVQRQMNQ